MLVVALFPFAGCSEPAGGSPDAGTTDTLATTDGAAAVRCDRGQACPAEHFCGASGGCVSAVAQVVAGANHSCARHRDGQVSCWGLAESINAGGGSLVPPSFVPDVRDPLALAAGTHQTCAITTEGRVRCWGNQAIAVVAEDGSPLAGVTGVAVGVGFGCAATSRGTFCWGKNDRGQLARPAEVDSSGPALLADAVTPAFLGAGLAVISHDGGDRLCAWGHNGTHLVTDSDAISIYRSPVCNPVPDVLQLVVGADHACVRHAAGTFACWGERYYGQLGLGGTASDTEDVPPHGRETALPAPVVDLAAGASHTCALLSDGRVACFGLDSLGQVGPDPGTSEQEVRAPAFVTGFSGRVVALASGASAQHTCALLEDGSVACWGSDHAGQLGDRPATLDRGRFSPSPVVVRW